MKNKPTKESNNTCVEVCSGSCHYVSPQVRQIPVRTSSIICVSDFKYMPGEPPLWW